jgi:steroid delta-isomerase-like uncharacterized protein
MHDQNKALVRRLFEECWNRGDLSNLNQWLSNDYVEHDPAERNFAADYGRGPDYFRKINQIYRSAFPDLRFDIRDLVAEGDRVVARWATTGTHRGPLMGISPTGKRTEVDGVSIHRIVDNRIQETWVVWDAFGLMRQLGVVGEPARSRA